jgi:hypothetical protein
MPRVSDTGFSRRHSRAKNFPRLRRLSSGVWLASTMGAGDYNVAFVDQVGRLIHDTITSEVPRVGDHVDLPMQRVTGEHT